jgi:hypothetical protein
MMKTDAEFADFAKRKTAFIAKWGDKLIDATEADRRAMQAEASGLAKLARLPVDQLLNRLAQRYLETVA